MRIHTITAASRNVLSEQGERWDQGDVRDTESENFLTTMKLNQQLSKKKLNTPEHLHCYTSGLSFNLQTTEQAPLLQSLIHLDGLFSFFEPYSVYLNVNLQ